MKKFNIKYTLLVASAAMLTGCIEETFPESEYATAEQVGASSAALEGSVNGLSSQMSQGYLVYGEQVHETDMAYPQFMIAQTEMLGDMYPGGDNSGYDWYRNYNCFRTTVGPDSYFAYLPWFTLYQFIKGANDIISSVNLETANETQRQYAGIAHASRAFDYYMLTVFYEPAKNIYTDCSKVLGLTVPIVDENTEGEQAKNNPRVPKAQMMEFIHNDLTLAEELLADYSNKTHLAPDLAVVYGLQAKTYMWEEKFDMAYEYATKAIQQAEKQGASMMTESEWTDPKTGFTTATSGWMWYTHYSPENMGNLCNFVGWMSGEADWGYASLTRPMIDASLYNKIGVNDFRKHVFLDPAKYDFYNYKTCRDEDYINDAPAYLALKFRCLNGDWEQYAIGGAIDVPIMRLEEMYLIQAEAAGASKSVEEGVALLNNWVNAYRDASYMCGARDLRQLQLAVLDQMRIEFWGEGNAFPSAKRLRPGVIQNYEGTNAPEDMFKINCQDIKPNWNFCIPNYETQSNQVLQDQNNPDPTQAILGPTEIGTYAQPK